MDNKGIKSSNKTKTNSSNNDNKKENLSDFNTALKSALNFNDKGNKKGVKMNKEEKSVKIGGGGK